MKILHKAQTNNQNQSKNREIGYLKMTNKNDLGFIVHIFILTECFIILQQTTTFQVTTIIHYIVISLKGLFIWMYL
jgi:hypothetical protein